jgi:hypothetical protein
MGESCFADTPCDRNIAPVPVPDLPSPPTSHHFNFLAVRLQMLRVSADSLAHEDLQIVVSLGLECFDTAQNGGTCA